ncbi:MAG: hypothetical protein AzoDbin1_05162 [Azoarcus sp.]|nr:hypothetical protein [Azoarcus sp.]
MPNLRPYQREIVGHILDTPRCGVWAGMGVGKTLSTLTALDTLTLAYEGPALVIAPLRVATSTWPAEIAKWAHLAHLRAVPIVGTPAQRTAALRAILTAPRAVRNATIATINYEGLEWIMKALRGHPWPFRLVVADESTRLKGFRTRQGGVRARALSKVAPHIERFVELTGTPAPNGLQDLWGQAWFLDYGERLGKTFTAFEQRWFRPLQVGQTAHAKKLLPLPGAQQQIEDALSDICRSWRAEDYFPLETTVETTIRVTLPPAARRAYDALARDLRADLAAGRVSAPSAAARTLKLHQAAQGAVYPDATPDDPSAQHPASGALHLHDAKLDALRSIVEEAAGEPLLVAYQFRHDAERIRKAFPQARMLDADPQTIAAWNRGDIPMLLAHPRSAGHGLNLQDGGRRLVMFAQTWALEERLQIVERIGPTRQAQSGHPRAVFIHHIIADGTLDDAMMQRMDSKRSVIDTLMEAMK